MQKRPLLTETVKAAADIAENRFVTYAGKQASTAGEIVQGVSDTSIEAGWYGGGGAVSGHYWAGSSANGSSEAAAGGGSSYTHPTLCSNVVHTQGYRTGNGYITISMVE